MTAIRNNARVRLKADGRTGVTIGKLELFGTPVAFTVKWDDGSATSTHAVLDLERAPKPSRRKA